VRNTYELLARIEVGATLVAVLIVAAGLAAAAWAPESLLGRGVVAGAAFLVVAESVAVFAGIAKRRANPGNRSDSN
jgi:hypothetical protein